MLPLEKGTVIINVRKASARSEASASAKPQEVIPAGQAAVRGAHPHGVHVTASPPVVQAVQDVEGEFIVRLPRRGSPDDLRFRMRGVYVPRTGSLRAVLEPTLPVRIEASQADVDAKGDTYRASLRDAARDFAIGFLPIKRWPAWGSRRGAGMHTHSRTGAQLGTPAPPPPPPPLQLRLFKVCEFRVSMRVYYTGDTEASEHAGFYSLNTSLPRPPPAFARRRPASTPASGGHGLEPQGASGAGAGAGPQGGAVARSRTARALLSALPRDLSAVLSGAARRLQEDDPRASHVLELAAGGDGSGGHTLSDGNVRSGQPQYDADPGAHGDVSFAAEPRPRLWAQGATAASGRRLSVDSEMYHSTQMQLHSPAVPARHTLLDTSSGLHEGGSGEGSAGPPDPWLDPDPDLDLVGVLSSPNCGLELAFNGTSLHLQRYYRKAVRYCVLSAGIVFMQLGLVVRQVDASSTPSAATRMSLYCVLAQAVMDAYACLVHLTAALVVDTLFGSLGGLAFLQFVLFAVFEMRQALLVWRAHQAAANGGVSDFWGARREMSFVYTRFYALLLSGLFLMFSVPPLMALLVLVLHSWWLPQIVHSATTDTRPPMRADYVLGMTVLRLLPPLYYFLCPDNVLRTAPQVGFAATLVVWVCLQAVVLWCQAAIGPRWMVPAMLLPQKYNYHRAATRKELGLGQGDHHQHHDSKQQRDAAREQQQQQQQQAHAAAQAVLRDAPLPHMQPAMSPAAAAAAAALARAAAAAAAATTAGGAAEAGSSAAAPGGGSSAGPSTSQVAHSSGSNSGGSNNRAAATAGNSTSGSSTSPSSASTGGRWLQQSLGRVVPALAGGAQAVRSVMPSWLGGARSGAGSEGGAHGGRDDVEAGHGSRECVICMNPVPLQPIDARMVTPCGHFFHETCLLRWMEVKMDCPTCRRPLPPP